VTDRIKFNKTSEDLELQIELYKSKIEEFNRLLSKKENELKETQKEKQ
jgi:hypothetical protein